MAEEKWKHLHINLFPISFSFTVLENTKHFWSSRSVSKNTFLLINTTGCFTHHDKQSVALIVQLHFCKTLTCSYLYAMQTILTSLQDVLYNVHSTCIWADCHIRKKGTVVESSKKSAKPVTVVLWIWSTVPRHKHSSSQASQKQHGEWDVTWHLCLFHVLMWGWLQPPHPSSKIWCFCVFSGSLSGALFFQDLYVPMQLYSP